MKFEVIFSRSPMQESAITTSQTLGADLRALRKARGLTLTDLSEVLAVRWGG